MTTEVHSYDAKTVPVEALAMAIGAGFDGMVESGINPHKVFEAAFLALLPLAIEVTRAETVEDALLALASKFNGNDLRREH